MVGLEPKFVVKPNYCVHVLEDKRTRLECDFAVSPVSEESGSDYAYLLVDQHVHVFSLWTGQQLLTVKAAGASTIVANDTYLHFVTAPDLTMWVMKTKGDAPVSAALAPHVDLSTRLERVDPTYPFIDKLVAKIMKKIFKNLPDLYEPPVPPQPRPVSEIALSLSGLGTVQPHDLVAAAGGDRGQQLVQVTPGGSPEPPPSREGAVEKMEPVLEEAGGDEEPPPPSPGGAAGGAPESESPLGGPESPLGGGMPPPGWVPKKKVLADGVDAPARPARVAYL